MTLDSVIAAHWAALIPTPSRDPLREDMAVYIEAMREPSTATPSRPSPPAAGTGGWTVTFVAITLGLWLAAAFFTWALCVTAARADRDSVLVDEKERR